MSLAIARRFAALALVATMAACGGAREVARTPNDGEPPPPPISRNGPSSYKIGKPYLVAGVRYWPQERFTYSETGRASWYGPGFHGRRTANGELYDQKALTAAHRTLQMPSIIRVTNVGNGKSAVLRVNDRGPYHSDRVLDVSEAAAEALDFKQLGTAKVRIEVLEGPSRQVAALAKDGAPIGALEDLRLAAATADTGPAYVAAPQQSPAEPARAPAASDIKLASVGAAVGTAEPVALSDQAFVQAGAFASLENAQKLERRLADLGRTEVTSTYAGSRKLYRVRLGPFADIATAEAALVGVQDLGVPGAHLVVIR